MDNLAKKKEITKKVEYFKIAFELKRAEYLDSLAKANEDEVRNPKKYYEQDALEAADEYFFNESTDTSAVIGLYVTPYMNDEDAAKKALKVFKEEIVDAPNERDTKIIEAFEEFIKVLES